MKVKNHEVAIPSCRSEYGLSEPKSFDLISFIFVDLRRANDLSSHKYYSNDITTLLLSEIRYLRAVLQGKQITRSVSQN